MGRIWVCARCEMTSSHLISPSHPSRMWEMRWGEKKKTGNSRDNPTSEPTSTHLHTHTHTLCLKALRRLSYEIVGAAGTQHVEGDAGLCVKVQPPLVVLLGEDEVERVTGAPLLRRLHQTLKLHPPVLRCPWLRSLMWISQAGAAMMLKTEREGEKNNS